ncbi:hypothetical protein FDP25_04460 [Roseovarius sp. A21]|uniref:Uncharacterized protein n=1 Tax=Roseovarius bejariae TaxID=2576383 RepID=A0A844CVH8_9RHOB|nr:hypothetical protein [Roseovarius bejariae]MRU14680.1 hypothetical protein [Roseovarius bejariae]
MAKRIDPGLPEADGPDRTQTTGRDGSPQETRAGTADDMIRKMMAEQRREKNLRSLPAIMPDEPKGISPEDQDARRARLERRQAWGRALNATPSTHYDTHHEEAEHPRRGGVARFFLREDRSGDGAEAEEPRTERRYALSLVIVSILVFQPQMIPGLLTMMFWTLFVASLLFGPGRVVDFLQGLWRLFLRRHPVLAAKLRGIRDITRGTVMKRLPGKIRARWLAGGTTSRDMGRNDDRDDSFNGQLEAGVFRG